jgi:hypothetical protein
MSTVFMTVADDGTFVWVDHERGVGRVAVYAGYVGMQQNFVSVPVLERVVVMIDPGLLAGTVREEIFRDAVSRVRNAGTTVVALQTLRPGGAFRGSTFDYVFNVGDGGVSCAKWACRDDQVRTSLDAGRKGV